MKESERLQQLNESYAKSRKKALEVLTLLNEAIDKLGTTISSDANAGNVDGSMFDNSYLVELREDELTLRDNINNVIAGIDSKTNNLDDQIASALSEEAAAEAAAALGA